MKTWFTSDTHWGHENIIQYCRRPYVKSAGECRKCKGTGKWPINPKHPGADDAPCTHPDVELMNRILIERWNARVGPEDLVYHLGDFAFGNFERIESFAKKLNGQIVLVRGNHDRLPDGAYIRMGFYVRNSMLIGKVHLQHRPPRQNENPRGVWLVGHVHEKWADIKTHHGHIINVGVDVRNFQPVSIEELGLSDSLLL